MKTVWSKYCKNTDKSALSGDIKRDIVVVGGGIAGVLTAYKLAERGKKVTLVEAEKLLSGVTRCTTAHLEALQGIKYSLLKNKTAALYYRSQSEAIDEFEKLTDKYGIDCNFKRQDSYLYAADDVKRLKKEYAALKAINADAEYLEDTELLGKRVEGAVKLKSQAAFDPIAFLSGLPVNFEILENTRITDLDFSCNRLSDGKNTIRAKKIIIATNFPIKDVPGWYFLRMYKSSSYAVSINAAEDIGGLYQDDGDSGCTFRSFGGKLIAGGLDHRSGRADGGKYRELAEIARGRGFGGAEAERWSANDCITFDGLPFIGYYTKRSKDVYVISGFNKWGMANSMAAATLITDMICGGGNPYEELFSPLRRMPFNLNFIKNALCVVGNLAIKPLLPPMQSYKDLDHGEGDIVFYKGRKKAVYKDDNGNFHICSPLCAHLKCQISFNCEDKTWDCPCHGSRFDVDGNIITAPAVKALKRYEAEE